MKSGFYQFMSTNSSNAKNMPVIHVKNNPKSYTFTLIRDTNSYFKHATIGNMFAGDGIARILKTGSKHGIKEWDDVSFTIYPNRLVTPYYY